MLGGLMRCRKVHEVLGSPVAIYCGGVKSKSEGCELVRSVCYFELQP
jgi:hypothetical protein